MRSGTSLTDHVLARLPDAALCVGLSGGVDSVVLLHLLAHAPTRRPLRAIHVNHGVHAESDSWAERCVQWCSRWNVPLTVTRACVVHRGTGVEAALRDARYAAFETQLQPGEALLTAHHLDDQAETLLLRALRASGIDGLGAIPTERELGAGRVIRPLLDINRARLHDYALEHALEWIEDPSNADAGYDRNFLRHRVLPLLRERWPHASAALAGTASLCRRDAALLYAEDRRLLASAATLDAHVIRRDVLAALPVARQARVLRHWVASLGLPPLPGHLAENAEATLLHGRRDAQPQLSWAGVTMRAWRDLLHVGRACKPLPASWETAWQGDAPLAVPGGGVLQLEGTPALHVPCVVHARRGGERITLHGRLHSHALKHVLQDLHVPPWERERLPLLSTCEGELLAAGDLVVSHGFDAWLRDHGARLRWHSTSTCIDAPRRR